MERGAPASGMERGFDECLPKIVATRGQCGNDGDEGLFGHSSSLRTVSRCAWWASPEMSSFLPLPSAHRPTETDRPPSYLTPFLLFPPSPVISAN